MPSPYPILHQHPGASGRRIKCRFVQIKREWHNHQKQIKHAEAIEGFLKGENTAIGDQKHKKTTTQGFYTWMKREVKGLYGQWG